MTGQEAVLEATGETFAEVEARRSNEGPPDPAPQFGRKEDDVAPDEADQLPGHDTTGATSTMRRSCKGHRRPAARRSSYKAQAFSAL